MNISQLTAQLRSLWANLTRRQQISMGVAALCVPVLILLFTNWRTTKDFRPLFSSMSAEDAGAIMAKLKEAGVEYHVSDNSSSIEVPASRVAELRLQMASAGLPRSGRIGYELFDRTSLGSTDFAEQVNYRRALEGELERSIRSISEVEQARVHLTFPKDSVFLESRLPAKASVLITLHGGRRLTPQNVNAIVHLVASGVEGLAPEAVSITDSLGNLLTKQKSKSDDEVSDELIEYRRKIEKDLTARISSTLDPLLGVGRYRVGLSVDCDITSGEQSEELYDPDKSVMVTTQKSEETGATAGAGGVPGTQSSLPRPVPRTAGSGGTLSRRTENITYQSSKTVRRTKMPQGGIRRISASVLLDQAVHWELRGGKQQRVLVPPSPESVRTIYDVVSAAVGMVPSRGDQLVVQSLPFADTLEKQPPAITGPDGKETGKPANTLPVDWKDWRVLSAAAALTLLLGAAGWFALRRKKVKKLVAAMESEALLAAPEEHAVASLPDGEAEAVEGSTGKLLAEAQERVTQTARIETLVGDLRNSIAGDPVLAANVLRTWLQEKEV